MKTHLNPDFPPHFSSYQQLCGYIPQIHISLQLRSELNFFPNFSFKSLHSLYLEDSETLPCSFFLFIKKFKKYDICLYVSKKDTCAKCHEIHTKMKATKEKYILMELHKSKKENLARASQVQNEMQVNEKMS